MRHNRRPLVLVADDETTVREFFSHALELEGFRVIAAADGREAMAALDEETPSAVILDMAMPHASGLAVLQRVREREETRHVPVIVVTGVEPDDELWAGRDWGWDLYLSKPVLVEDLTNALNKMILQHH